MKLIKIFILAILLNYFPLSVSNSEVINQIKIEGNKRITDEIILMFSQVNVGKDINSTAVNEIIKNLYETNFFNNVSVVFEDNLVLIIVDEAPIIDKVIFTGLKAKKIEKKIRDNLKLKSRNSYNEFLMVQEVNTIESTLKTLGYYFSKVEAHIETLENNMINLEYKIDIGNKAKIGKISFLGNKIFKDKKLKSIIISEEYKLYFLTFYL